MATLYQWKSFEFFERAAIPEADRLQNIHITCGTSGRGHLLFGDADGVIHIFDRTFQEETILAFETYVTHIRTLKTSNVVAAIGADEGATLKLWSLEKRDAKGAPALLKHIKLFGGGKVTPPPGFPLRLSYNPNQTIVSIRKEESERGVKETKVDAKNMTSPVVSFDILEEEKMHHAVFGLTNGTIVLIRCDLLHTRQVPVKMLKPPPSEEGKAIHFVGLYKAPNSTDAICYAVHPQSSYIWTISAKENVARRIEDEFIEVSSPADCCSVSEEGELILAQSNCVYYFTPDGCRGSTYAFEGEKRKVFSFNRNLVVVSVMDYSQLQATKKRATEGRNAENMIVTIYDVKTQLKAFSGEKAHFVNVSNILYEWGALFIHCNQSKPDGVIEQNLFKLEEKDTRTKLDMLFKKNLFSKAIAIAKANNFDESSFTDVVKKYADYLYTSGDYDGAIREFIRTIKKLEPSYVIRKFLDAQHINNLTNYLEALHVQGQAKPDHTTLLINCYTKLKDVSKLDKFINETSCSYDVQTAIRVCRQAKYCSHALQLALKNQEHTWCVRIQIEDLNDPEAAIKYISKLSISNAEVALERFGKDLIIGVPESATSLFIRICTQWDSASRPPRLPPQKFINCFADCPYYMLQFLETIVQTGVAVEFLDGHATIWDTLLELYLCRYLRKNPQDVPPSESTPAMQEDFDMRRQKALDVLKNRDAQVNREHALFLVQSHDFRAGILHLYEELYLIDDLLQYYMRVKDHKNLIAACKHFGKKDPNHWVPVLLYFTEGNNGTEEELKETLSNIEQDDLLSPLIVLQIISKNKQMKLSTIKDFIKRRLEKDFTCIKEDESQIDTFKKEIQSWQSEITDIQHKYRQFQIQRCQICTSTLELPATHFLCGHSFHTRCLAEDTQPTCPLCHPEIHKVREIKLNLEEAIEKHDTFFAKLQEGQDSFTTVADYFGRGIFNKQYPAVGNADTD